MTNPGNVAFAYVVNALWQLPLLVLVAELTLRVFRGPSARVLHRLWLGCFVLALVVPAFSFLHPSTLAPLTPPFVQHAVGNISHLGFANLQPMQPKSNPYIHQSSPNSVFQAICLLYLASVLFALARLAWGLGQAWQLLKAAQPANLSPELEASWQRCLALSGETKITLLVSDRLSGPATLNWPTPIVVLPAELRGAEPQELTAAFCHELAHVRRNDFFNNLLCEIFGALLFFHPAMHWIRRRIQETRELTCDDLAADVLRGRHAYARNLLQLTQKMRSVADIPQPGCALGIFEGEILEKRIMNLIQNKAKQSRARASASVVFGICLFMVSCLFCAEFGLNPLAAQVDSGPAKAPAGWILTGSKPADYRVGIDKSVVLEGQPSAFLKSVVASSVAATDKATTQGLGPFGTMMQTVSAVNFAGKRVRFKAQVKSQDVADWAGLWMRYDRGREMLFLDNMQTRPIKGSQPWKNYEVVLDVPADATSISFGVLLAESGEVWMNQATFEVVGNDVAVTAAPPPPHVLPSTPKNLNFSE